MFEHSVMVPRLYRTAAKITENACKNVGSVKNLVYQVKHPNIRALYALVVETMKHNKQIDFLFKRTKLLEKEPRLNPWLARVLVTELLWGKKRLSSESKPVKIILAYHQIFNAHAADVYETSPVNQKVLKPRFVRVNTILTSVKYIVDTFRDEGWTFVRHMETKNYDGFLEKVKNLAENEFMTDTHIPELLIFPPNTEFHSHDAYKSGLIVLQDKASCFPVHLLNPSPGSTVLDMCAAPGMKTSQLAAKLNNNGKVYAVDMNTKRLKTLETLMETSGSTCVTTINKDVLQVTNKDCPNVEYILVDPSCSGSGIVDRLDLITPTLRNERRIEKLKGFQIMILKHALKRFPNAKRVIYSTCSIYPEENEEVIKEIVTQNNRFKLISASDLLNGPWYNFGSEKYGDIGKSCLYLKSDLDLTNGFFIAVFERLCEGEENVHFIENPKYPINRTNDFSNNLVNKLDEDNSCTSNPSSKKKRSSEEAGIDIDLIHKKRKKTVDKNVTIETSSSTQNETEVMENEETSSTKKKKKARNNDSAGTSNTEENCLENGSKNVRISSEFFDNANNDGTSAKNMQENEKKKKKKKHKKQRHENNLENDCEHQIQAKKIEDSVDTNEIQATEQSKKRKHKHKDRKTISNNKIDKNHFVNCDETEKNSEIDNSIKIEENKEKYKSKKNKHKKKGHINTLAVDDQHNADIIKKKKRKSVQNEDAINLQSGSNVKEECKNEDSEISIDLAADFNIDEFAKSLNPVIKKKKRISDLMGENSNRRKSKYENNVEEQRRRRVNVETDSEIGKRKSHKKES